MDSFDLEEGRGQCIITFPDPFDVRTVEDALYLLCVHEVFEQLAGLLGCPAIHDVGMQKRAADILLVRLVSLFENFPGEFSRPPTHIKIEIRRDGDENGMSSVYACGYEVARYVGLTRRFPHLKQQVAMLSRLGECIENCHYLLHEAVVHFATVRRG